jgi:DNA-binding NtrC family response regulator
MKPERKKHILVIDQQTSWRNQAEGILKDAAFSTHTFGEYNYPQLLAYTREKHADLIVLGCAHIGPDEQKLIEFLLKHHSHLLVFCTCFSTQIMRALFLKGVADIEDKTYNQDAFLEAIHCVLKNVDASSTNEIVEREVLL